MNKNCVYVVTAVALLFPGISAGAEKEMKDADMTFFLSSVGSGKGADFGGLAGADKHCQNLAAGAGGGKHTWRAYLSTTGSGGVNARDRIGKGPWYNAEGRLIARDVAELHGVNGINRMTALTEKKTKINGRAESPNQHDVLTGSKPDGTASTDSGDTTCSNWTSSDKGSALVGHHDRWGLQYTDQAMSWNSSHGSKGCSQPALVSTGGAGLIYCFAADGAGAPAAKAKAKTKAKAKEK
ncbi:MAG TPA: hypothetical protein VFC14_18395 [Burkholderiales bacterium]|nr:hypothetical protein [Burkholderiales bacterium]